MQKAYEKACEGKKECEFEFPKDAWTNSDCAITENKYVVVAMCVDNIKDKTFKVCSETEFGQTSIDLSCATG